MFTDLTASNELSVERSTYIVLISVLVTIVGG